MHRMTRIFGVLALLALVAGFNGSSNAEDPTTKDIMVKAHKGADALVPKLGKELKADKPDWDAITKESKELVELGTALGKNKPSKGEKESWDKLTASYLANAKDLEAAAEKKDVKAATAAQGKLAASCKECHTAHKK